MTTMPTRPTSSPGRTLARLSWLAAVGVVVLTGILSPLLGALVADLAALALDVVGVVLGILALARVGREGRQGILVPALVGLVLNGLLLVIWVTNFLAVRARLLH